jgi:hypothetical protein
VCFVSTVVSVQQVKQSNPTKATQSSVTERSDQTIRRLPRFGAKHSPFKGSVEHHANARDRLYRFRVSVSPGMTYLIARVDDAKQRTVRLAFNERLEALQVSLCA